MSPPDLEKLRQSGRISAAAREHGRKLIVPGANLREIADSVETLIYDLGGKPAFPAQLSRNNIAAHYCSPPGDELVAEPSDIIKLDTGVHVDGWVTDNAVTVDLAGGPNSALVAASRMALDNAISVMGPDAPITEIGNQIETTIKAFGFNPIYNLTGHGVARYVIHCAPSLPNYPDPRAGRLQVNQTIACEPFACDGKGYIDQDGTAQVFGLKRKIKAKDRLPKDVADAIAALDSLPFCRRSLLRHLDSIEKVEMALRCLTKARVLVKYPPLAEKRGVRVAQSEHTIFIHEDRAEVLTIAPEEEA